MSKKDNKKELDKAIHNLMKDKVPNVTVVKCKEAGTYIHDELGLNYLSAVDRLARDIFVYGTPKGCEKEVEVIRAASRRYDDTFSYI